MLKNKKLHFHHIGIACCSINDEVIQWEFLGYQPEGSVFIDSTQGIRGLFMIGGGVRIELLEATQGSNTLAPWLKRKIKMYHLGYLTPNLSEAIAEMIASGAVITREPMFSEYFRSNIVFLTLPNLVLIELIEFPSHADDEN